MVPRTTDWVAGNSGRHPLVIHVVVDVPLVTAGDSALMPTNIRFPTGELVNVELQSLRNAGIFHPKINVVGESVKTGIKSMFGVREALRRKAPN